MLLFLFAESIDREDLCFLMEVFFTRDCAFKDAF